MTENTTYKNFQRLNLILDSIRYWSITDNLNRGSPFSPPFPLSLIIMSLYSTPIYSEEEDTIQLYGHSVQAVFLAFYSPTPVPGPELYRIVCWYISYTVRLSYSPEIYFISKSLLALDSSFSSIQGSSIRTARDFIHLSKGGGVVLRHFSYPRPGLSAIRTSCSSSVCNHNSYASSLSDSARVPRTRCRQIEAVHIPP
jgi:hypothetical protein